MIMGRVLDCRLQRNPTVQYTSHIVELLEEHR